MAPFKEDALARRGAVYGGSYVGFEFLQKAEDLAFIVEPVAAVGDFLFGAQDGVVAEIRRNGEGALDGQSAHQAAAERRSKHVARAVERTFDAGDGDAAFAFLVHVVDKVAVLCFCARDHGVRAHFCECRERLRKVFGARQKIALRLVGQNIVCLFAQREHLFGKRFVKPFVEGKVVAQHGIDDEHAALFQKTALDLFDKGDLCAAAQIAAVDHIVFEPQRLPMVGDLFHLVVEVQKGIPRKSARMGGEQRRGQNVAGDAAGGDDGERHRQRAFPHAGDIVDGKNAHKSCLRISLFFIIRPRARFVNES